MKSGSIRRSEESAVPAAMRSKRSTGGLPLPTVPLPGGSCGFGGRVSEPCGYNNYSQTQLQQHRHENHHHQNHQPHPRQQCQMDNGQQKYVDDDDNDESFACSGDTVDNKENTNNNHISPDNSSYEQHLCSGSSSVVSDSYGSYATSSQTIALFGASGITGGHFLQMALDAGYGVRCLPVDDPREVGGGKGPCVANGAAAGWKTIKAALEDTKQVKRVLKSADFVVVMLNDLLPGKNKEYPVSFLSDFAARLYPLMRRQASIQVFLYQVRHLARQTTVIPVVCVASFALDSFYQQQLISLFLCFKNTTGDVACIGRAWTDTHVVQSFKGGCPTTQFLFT